MDDRSAALSDAFWQAKRNGLTMKAFTEAVKREAGGVRGTSESALRDYLHGRIANPRREILIAMARVLGMEEVGELLRLGQVLHPSYANAFDSNEAVMVRAWLCDWHIDLSRRQKKQLGEAGKRIAEERGQEWEPTTIFSW
jgi:transcriptional regulator with XRE-family HTH domain